MNQPQRSATQGPDCLRDETAPEVVIASDLVEINDANDRGLIPRRSGRKRSRTELWSMRKYGRLNSNGDRIRLRTIVEGRTVFTTADWINAYFTALASCPQVTPTRRERQRRSFGNTKPTPQIRPEAAATLRRHGLASSAGLED